VCIPYLSDIPGQQIGKGLPLLEKSSSNLFMAKKAEYPIGNSILVVILGTQVALCAKAKTHYNILRKKRSQKYYLDSKSLI